MKKELILFSVSSSVLIIAVLISFSFLSAAAQPTNVTFSVNLTITGNAAPTITWVQSGLSATPIESSATTVYVAFNATDNNGYADINYSSARVILFMDGEQQRASTSCIAYNNDSLNMQINCTVNMQYYDQDGIWTINASVQDLNPAFVNDTSGTFTFNTLQAVRGNLQGITFGNVNLASQSGATNDPLVLNNTGNQNFTVINITAYNLIGQSTPAEIIPATSLYVNATVDAFGTALANNTETVISGAAVPRDISGAEANQNIYFWVDVPAAGLTNQNYVSSSNWLIEVS